MREQARERVSKAPLKYLHRGALGRQLGKAHDVGEVDGDRLVGFGGHVPVLLELLGDRGRQHLVEQHVRTFLLVG